MADEELNNGGEGGNEQTPVISQARGKDSTLVIGGQKVYPRTFLHNVYGEDGTTNLNTLISGLQGEHSSLSSRITSNYQAITNLTGRANTLETKVGNEADNTDPQNPVAATGLIADVRTLQGENTAVKGRVSALETQVGHEADNTDPSNPVAATGLVADLRAAEADIDAIEAVIPAAATSSNKLVDKAAMDEAIENLAASYVTSDASGNAFATKVALTGENATYFRGGQSYTPNKNDYAIVLADESKIVEGTSTAPTSRYVFDGTQWAFQYIVHNTALTNAQLNAMNSGITSSLVTQIGTNQSDISDLKLLIGNTSSSSLNTRIETLEDAINGTGDAPNHVKGISENLADVMSDLNTASTGLKARMTTAEGDIDSLETRMSTAETILGHDADNSDPENPVTASGLVADVRAIQSSLNATSTDFGTRITAAEGDIDSLETRMGAAEGDIDSLEGRMDTAEGDIDTLQSDLNTANTGLKARMTTAEGNIDALESDVGHASDSTNNVVATGLHAAVEENASDISALQTQVGVEASGNNPATGLVADLRNAESDIDALEADLGHASDSANNITATGLHADVETNAANIAANAANISDIIDILAGDPEDADNVGLVTRLTAAESAIGRIEDIEETLNGTGEAPNHVKGVVENLGAPNAAASNDSAFGRIKSLEETVNGYTDSNSQHVDGLSDRVSALESGSQEALTPGTHITIDTNNNNTIDVIVDNALSDSSTHPVQNAVVKAALDTKIECSDDVDLDMDIDYETLTSRVAALEAAIVEIQSSRIINVATEAEMDQLLVAENVGKVYRFIGTTTAKYTQGDLYQVEVGND